MRKRLTIRSLQSGGHLMKTVRLLWRAFSGAKSAATCAFCRNLEGRYHYAEASR